MDDNLLGEKEARYEVVIICLVFCTLIIIDSSIYINLIENFARMTASFHLVNSEVSAKDPILFEEI